MNLRTFGQLKSEIARVCGATGMPAADPRVLQFTNLAVEELLNEADFPWTVERIIFQVYNGRIVLPTDYDRIISLSVDGIPQQINSPWYETTPGAYDYWYASAFGPNIPTTFGNAGVTLDRDTVFQFRDIPEDQPYYLRVSCQYPEDEGETLRLLGYDEMLNPVRTFETDEWVAGEKFTLNTTPAQSTSTFSQITGIIKPVTQGEVWVDAVGPNGSTYRIGTYAPGDTSPFYRSYKVTATGCAQLSCVVARCRRRYRPVLTDNDFVLCGNVPALKKMVQAVWYSDGGDLDKYAQYKAFAVDLLRKEATAFRGKSRIPALSFQRGFSLGGYPYVH